MTSAWSRALGYGKPQPKQQDIRKWRRDVYKTHAERGCVAVCGTWTEQQPHSWGGRQAASLSPWVWGGRGALQPPPGPSERPLHAHRLLLVNRIPGTHVTVYCIHRVPETCYRLLSPEYQEHMLLSTESLFQCVLSIVRGQAANLQRHLLFSKEFLLLFFCHGSLWQPIERLGKKV